MDLLITANDVTTYCRVSSNIPSAQMTRFIRESQIFDVIPLLGWDLTNALLNDLNTSPPLQTERFSLLYNGGECENNSGDKYYLHGIKMFHAYCTYKRLLDENSVNLTAFGVVQKIDELSQPLTDVQMAMITNKVNEKVMALRDNVYNFLCMKSADYNEWKNYQIKNYRKIKVIGD